MKVNYYVIYDPNQQLGEQVLNIYQLVGRHYLKTQETWLEDIGLGINLWQGEFEGRQDTWLRWFHQDGTVVPTGDERADREKLEKEEAQKRAQSEKLEKEEAQKRAQSEKLEKEEAQKRAQSEKLEKEEAQKRAQLLAEKLRELGVDPDAIG